MRTYKIIGKLIGRMLKSALRLSPYQSSATTPRKLFEEIDEFIKGKCRMNLFDLKKTVKTQCKANKGCELHCIKCDVKSCYDQVNLERTIMWAWHILKLAALNPGNGPA